MITLRKIQKFGIRYYLYKSMKKDDKADDILQKYYLSLPESKYKDELEEWFRWTTGCKLDFDNPRNWSEKLQWLKIYDNTELKGMLSDKYEARKWVGSKIGKEHLVECFGAWENFDDIPFGELPDRFVLKATHGSGWNIIVNDKYTFDKDDARIKFNKWLDTNMGKYVGLELQYANIFPRIMAEKYLSNENGIQLYDYKIHCFMGKPTYIQVIGDRNFETHMAVEAIYDAEWNRTPYATMFAKYENDIKRPKNLEEMLEIAGKLAEGFYYVRVDLYSLCNGEIYFGEMTFTPGAGITVLSEDANKIWGDKIELPER